jgi:hypothetical protein
MILLAFFISFFTDKNTALRLNTREWLLLLVGTLIVIISYILDYSTNVLQGFSLADLIGGQNGKEIFSNAEQYVPRHFNWWIFSLGELFILSGIASLVVRNKNLN